MKRQGLLSSAIRRTRRIRRTSARFLVLALGFGVAYYLDTENGEGRRKQLQHWLRRTSRRLESIIDFGAEDPPPVFSPVLQGMPGGRTSADAVGAGVR